MLSAIRQSALHRLLVVVSLVGLLALMTWSAIADEKTAGKDFTESWNVLYIGKSRIGYGRSTTEKLKRDGRDIVVSATEISMTLVRFGTTIRTRALSQTEETPDGDLLRFRFEMQTPPAGSTITSGRVEGDKLRIENELAGASRAREVPWDNKVKSSEYQNRTLRENPLKPGEQRTLRVFSPEFQKVGTVSLKAGGYEQVKLLSGETKKLLKVNSTFSLAPTAATEEYLDESGEVLLSSMSMLGMNIVTHLVSKEEALKALSGEEVDLAVATLVKTKPLDRSLQTKRVVYRVSLPGEGPEKTLAVGPTQEIKPVDAETVDLTVRAISPPSGAPADASSPAREFTAPSAYIQSDDALVKKCADEAAGGESDSWVVAKKMERWVRDNVRDKNFSTLLGSAAEVAKSRSGDCTEHAVLLAAMARARSIPSRVVVGLLYVPQHTSFGGHMWTEVSINGQWIPLDATLGQGGIAADHIKFADTSFADDGKESPLTTFLPLVGVLGKLKIEIKEVEYR